MQNGLADYNSIPAIFWAGHLVVALIGLVLLHRRAGEVPSTRRAAYLAIGGLLVLAGLVPAAFASMITVGLVLGGLALVNAPIGTAIATALASPVGLLSAFVVFYLIVRATAYVFARPAPSNQVTSS